MKIKQTIFILAILFSLSACNILLNREKFDSLKWKNGNARVRGSMAHDLEDSRILTGKTESEVAEILGKPETYWSYPIETNLFWETYFSIEFNETTHKAESIDIGD